MAKKTAKKSAKKVVKKTAKSAKVAKPKNAAKSKRAKSKSREHVHYHRDGTIWAKGEMRGDVMVGYWEWFRKDGSKMRSGSFEDGEQAGDWTTYDRKGKVVKVTRMKRK